MTAVRATDQIAKELSITSSPSIYLFNLDTLSAQPVNVARDGNPGNGPSFDASISGDGRYISFASQASNLVESDTNGKIDVFLMDRETGTVDRLSVRADGSELDEDSGVVHPGRFWMGVGLDISDDGEWVIYSSGSDDVIDQSKIECEFTVPCQNIYVTNTKSRQSYLINNSNVDFLPFTSLSADGNFGLFMAHSPNCEPEDFCSDMYLYNRLENETHRLGGYGSNPDLTSLKQSLWDDSYLYSMHTDRVTSVAFSPDQETIASASWDGLVKLFSMETDHLVATLEGNQQQVNAVTYSPNGELLSAAYQGDEVFIWRLPEQNLVGVLPGYPGVRALDFSPDDQFLAMGGTGGVWLWYLADGFLEDTLEMRETRVTALDYSSTGDLLAAASDDGTVWVWRLPEKQVVLRLGGHAEQVNDVRFSPDGSMIATASNDGTINVWEIRDLSSENSEVTNLFTLDHRDWVTGIAFTPDSSQLVSGSFDGRIVVWDLEDPNEIKVLFHQTQNPVLAVQISPHGDSLAAGTVRGEVHYWKDFITSLNSD